MAHLILRPGWYIPESACTTEAGYRSRRAFIKKLGLGTVGLAALGTGCQNADGPARGTIKPGEAPSGNPANGLVADPQHPLDAIPADAPRAGYPAPRVTEGFPPPGREITERLAHATYNNFYEFKNQGDLKDLWELTGAYDPFPWTVEVSGLVEEERTFDVDALVRQMDLEERVYRFRCVEAWSMTVPWTGFPLRALVDACRPLSSARYVRFVSADRPSQMPGLADSDWYPWPYFEALRMDEATNDLAFVAVGSYGEPLPKQNGSPFRLVIPWKYGYKGPKAVQRIVFTDEQPPTFWNELQPAEYSFLSNVNPNVPHPRWSQATERFIASREEERRVETLLFNGYAEQVGTLYTEEPRG